MMQGTYQFQLQVTDNSGATAVDVIQVTVVAGNIPPTSNAGTDQTIQLPANTVSLNGIGSDVDGTITYSWTKVSGPASGTITNSSSATTTVAGMTQGVYQFQLKVTDNKGAYSLDTIQVNVNSASTLLPAVNPANSVNGLNYNYYQGTNYSALPVFSTLTPVKSGTCSNFDISLAKRTTTFAFNFTGYVMVPADGQYTFYTTSDDGSNLYIDNVRVLNNDGLHGATEKSGTIGLKAGKHAISVGYFQQTGGKVLTVSYSGVGVTKQAIPASKLYRVSAPGFQGATLSEAFSIGTIKIAPAKPGMRAYPNPFVNNVEITIPGGIAGEYQLTVMDASGRTIWTKSGLKTTDPLQQSINTSNFVSGIYFVRLVQSNGISVTQLVK